MKKVYPGKLNSPLPINFRGVNYPPPMLNHKRYKSIYESMVVFGLKVLIFLVKVKPLLPKPLHFIPLPPRQFNKTSESRGESYTVARTTHS